MRFCRSFLFILLALCLPACAKAPRPVQPTPLWATVTPAANSTPTLTPFVPSENAPTGLPTPASTSDVPPPAAPLVKPEGAVSILLLGSDQRPGHSDFRTDVFILLILRGDGSLSLVSFPRDLYVYMPGRGQKNRINAAYEFGGFELAAQTLEYNFGLRPDHFVLTSFSGFQYIVDSLGGVDVNVGLPLSDTRAGYPDGYTVYPGVVHMDGETALWYIRSRATTSDFDRLRRAQEVLVAIGEKLLTLQGLARIPELYQAYQSSVVTDLTLDDLLALLPLLQQVDANRIDRYAIAPPFVTVWINPDNGAYLLLPDVPVIQQILQQALKTP
jgi:LCP family protein required for cell wall assembly